MKSLIYLSLEAEARKTYHHQNPHTQIEKCTTHEIGHELNVTFIFARNTTFNRFNFFIFQINSQPHESLETCYSRIREAGALFKFKELEEDLVKNLFISNMTNTSIHMDLLSEVCTPQQVLNFAINRERGQANQQEILNAHKTTPVGHKYPTLEIDEDYPLFNAPYNNSFYQPQQQEKSNHATNVVNHS